MEADRQSNRVMNVLSIRDLARQALIDDGWTPEQIAMWDNDPDAVEAMLELVG